ncbi:tyrosine-type recombinase/integrase [Flavobacterium oreochromis]|uniref:tyrosine-type recombinase/integrase n=1 Tax=Flavobacterium oreochromis TaxID=2906078 RepID=UPI001CE52011|nr:tyrosine-type recombinase/integrase [Flavobacterium oreochromis]QYS85985.1 tyrosine-type recombinase/integrase [Flavobacterium oreochromis]
MKQLHLKNESYREIHKDFKNWLDILGYAESTQKSLPNHLKEFFYYLEEYQINLINVQTIKNYYHHLKTRNNQTRDGGLSNTYLNKHIQALIKLNDYLKAHNAKPLPIHLKREEYNQRDSLQILTQEEIKQLFKATEYSNEQERIRKRDKVILVLLYSCGLRRNEAINLEIKDILFDKERIYVRKGKNYKERYVPINDYNLKIIEEYIYDFRPTFYNYKQTEYLLINYRGIQLLGQTLCNRLRAIEKASGIRESPSCGGVGEALFTSSYGNTNISNVLKKLSDELKLINYNYQNAIQIRNSVIVNWLKSNNLRKTQYLAGHRYISSTERYQQDNLEELHEMINTFHPAV